MDSKESVQTDWQSCTYYVPPNTVPKRPYTISTPFYSFQKCALGICQRDAQVQRAVTCGVVYSIDDDVLSFSTASTNGRLAANLL